MEVWQVDPGDEPALVAWHDVLREVDRELLPGESGFGWRDIRAFAQFTGRYRRFDLLAVGEPGRPGGGGGAGRSGHFAGVAMMESPLRDNLHSVEITLAVRTDQRRRGIGSALVDHMARMATADGRGVLNSIVDVPVSVASTHPSTPFARQVGFEATMPGNRRRLRVPVDPERVAHLTDVVEGARDAADYRTFTFESPWPRQYDEDQAELLRRMSTDEPAGDGEREEEEWTEERLRENEALVAARGARKIVAVAEHVPSRRLVAVSELLVSEDAPDQSWQLETLVLPQHRGHRLGLAVKLANLEALARFAPSVRTIVTGNAAVNAPMIAVNDLMGFEIAGSGWFWQKSL